MGNGNRSGDSSAGKECDVGLGLNMQHTESYPCKKMTVMPHPSDSPYHHHQHLLQASPDCSGYGGGGYGGTMFSMYDDGSSVSGGASVLPFSSSNDTSFKSTGGVMAVSGKVLFTATQWQELERQTMIYKYIVASIPVPPQLLLPFTKTPSHISVSQSNTAGLDLRFSSGSDPEPWRCRRTDGKKWRCSRDVAPDQKYCERHAHKTRPRSRKPVEIQSHNPNTTTTATGAAAVTLNKQSHRHIYSTQERPPLLPAAYNNMNNTFQRSISQFPSMVSATSSYHQQPRCTEWFMKSGTIPISSSTQQFQQSMQSPGVGSKRDHDKNLSFFQQEHEIETQMSYNPYLNSTSSDTSDTTRHFIDAWSRGGREREEVGNETGNNKCSLTLSMQSGGNGRRNGIDEDDESFQMGGVGMLNAAAWMGSTPGGPLGEALCLGIAGNAKGTPNAYSNSTSTSSSCEDGGPRGLSFTR